MKTCGTIARVVLVGMGAVPLLDITSKFSVKAEPVAVILNWAKLLFPANSKTTIQTPVNKTFICLKLTCSSPCLHLLAIKVKFSEATRKIAETIPDRHNEIKGSPMGWLIECFGRSPGVGIPLY